MNDSVPGVRITLDEIYKQVKDTDDKVEKLTLSVSEMVAINKRLDQHHERLNTHGERLGTVETFIEVQRATTKPRAPWYSIAGGIVGIGTGVLVLVQLIQISNSL